MRPEIVDLNPVIEEIFRLRKIAWNTGITALMAAGMHLKEASDKLADIWKQISVEYDRRHIPGTKVIPTEDRIRMLVDEEALKCKQTPREK